MKKILMEDTLALASNWVLYWYDDQVLLCDENDEFAYIELGI